MLSLQQAKATKLNLDDNLVPAINIVFLLLIFFMVAGQISKQYGGVVLPVSSSESALQSPKVVIRIEAENRIFLDDVLLQGDLLGALRELSLAPDTPVICFAERSLKADVLDQLLESARTLGLENLTLATELQ